MVLPFVQSFDGRNQSFKRLQSGLGDRAGRYRILVFNSFFKYHITRSFEGFEVLAKIAGWQPKGIFQKNEFHVAMTPQYGQNQQSMRG